MSMNLAQKRDGMKGRGFFKVRRKGFSARVSRSRKALNRTFSHPFPLMKDTAADLRLNETGHQSVTEGVYG